MCNSPRDEILVPILASIHCKKRVHIDVLLFKVPTRLELVISCLLGRRFAI